MEAAVFSFLIKNAGLSASGALVVAVIIIYFYLSGKIKNVEATLRQCRELNDQKRDAIEQRLSELKSDNEKQHDKIFQKLDAIYQKLIGV